MNHPAVRFARSTSVVLALSIVGCAGHEASAPDVPAAETVSSQDTARFQQLERDIIAHTCRYQPTTATALGLHGNDMDLEDYSIQSVMAEIAALRGFRTALAALDPGRLPKADALDRELLLHSIDSRVLTLDVIRPWENNPDVYSSGITNTAYVMVKWNFAPPGLRMKLLTEREKKMPAVFSAARANLKSPPRILTEIALAQIDGSREFFASSVPEAFKDVANAALVADFRAANAAVITALDDYKHWLNVELLPRSNGEFRLGEPTYCKKLSADEMIDVPLDRVLAIANNDLRKNQAAFAEAAKQIDPSHSPAEILASMQLDHPPADRLLATTQAELDSLAKFLTDHHIVTIPKAAPARVQETPPFRRATTSASMDTPGPFEKVATDAYYSMTLPDPTAGDAAAAEFMKQWYYAAITNVSVHEVWPGHYLQFLYAPAFPSDTRRVFGANTNIEGWAHYCEQMVLDEGFHAGEPKYRLAQLQDALLRDARCIVGIQMHTRGMTLEQATDFFEKEAYQPRPVADSEAKRGTTDATYGYYTLGKLMILRLREEVRAKRGEHFRLQEFHDDFLKLGPLPLPLVRRAMLGDTGDAL